MVISTPIDLPPDVYLFHLHEGEKIGKSPEYMIQLYLAQRASRITAKRRKQVKDSAKKTP